MILTYSRAVMLPALDPSRASLLHAVQDSVRIESPLPDPLVPVVQWIFQRPGWVMVAGLVVGAIVALVVLALLWKYRRELLGWLRTRNRGLKVAMAATVAVVLIAAAGTGVAAMDYMENDNDFCLGCHVMIPSGEPFVRPDTGTYLIVNKIPKESPHDSLRCHDCHEPDMIAQAKQLWFWMTDRPEMIPPHGELQNHVCEKCHQQGEAKESWQRVAATAGHKVHFESDSLPDLKCVNCHALEVHRFVPVDSTCYQQGCHLREEVDIRIGAMRDQTDLHCVTCHEFTAEPVFKPRGPQAEPLTPSEQQCFSCHAMRRVLEAFDAALDPHDATCGMCHNPHEQETGRAATATCATAQCHADWRSVRFHVGAAHRKVAERCVTCHQPHAARVDASGCEDCHDEVRRQGGRNVTPPVPFDTTRALRQTHQDLPRRNRDLSTTSMGGTVQARPGPSPPSAGPPGVGLAHSLPLPADSFSHRQHRKLTCLTCHTVQSGRGALRFEAPRGCQICHHQAPSKSRCEQCHEGGELTEARPMTVHVTVREEAPRAREVPFEHGTHSDIRCQECHTEPVSLSTAPPVRACTACHEEHHAEDRGCAACHRTGDPADAHGIETAHAACTECHDQATVVRLAPVRAFCLACHEPATDHYPVRECTECHFQISPEAYRPRLSAAGAPE